MTPFVLLEKPKGGLRPIGLNWGFYRVWVRVRRNPPPPIWEQEHRRPFFSAAAGSGAEDTVFQQSIRVEAGVNQGDEAVALLYDGEAFYERIPWDLLIRCASELGFPTALVRLAVATYACPRVIIFHGMLARELRPTRGITPGCGWATTLVKVAYLQMLAVVASKLPRSLTLDVHIDDFLLCGVGKGPELAQDFKLGETWSARRWKGNWEAKSRRTRLGWWGLTERSRRMWRLPSGFLATRSSKPPRIWGWTFWQERSGAAEVELRCGGRAFTGRGRGEAGCVI